MSVIRKTVNLIHGRLSGVQKLLPNGKSFLSFKGIPYAEPPIGKLRFARPVALQKFNDDPLDCSKEGDMCLQNDMITNEKRGSENCLFLNVYTPNPNDTNRKFPVMLFLHGGGFATGNGNSDLHSPEYLVQENVIVVTCNYRLGAFGFLYLPKAQLHGNAGLYDQLLVLKWINENIKEFNGDPNNVTLFGGSAGGVSATIHFISPNSRKYFHKLISQSGTVCNNWKLQFNPQEKTRKLASLLGCQSKSDKEILEFLRSANADDIFEHSKKTISYEEIEREFGFRFPFKPVIELSKEDSIFPQYPNENMRMPDNCNIPIMIGYNSDEGMMIFRKLLKTCGDYNKDYTKLLPLTLNIQRNTQAFEAIAKEVKEYYFGDLPINKQSIDKLINVVFDRQFLFGIDCFINFLKQYQKKSTIYYYRFSVDDELNMFKKMSNIKGSKGAWHADELFYLFKSNLSDPNLDENSKAAVMRRTMCKMWTNFAKFGNPTPDSDTELMFKWNPLNVNGVTPDNNIFEIGNDKIEVIPNPDRGRVEFLKNIYTKVNGSIFNPKLYSDC